MNRHIHELESENKFLKKWQPSSPEASDEGQILAHAGEEGNLQRLDDGTRTEVSRSGFYRWLKAGGGEDPWGPLKEAICAIWEESDRRFSFC